MQNHQGNILEDADNLPRLLAYSIYGTNPVHVFITVTQISHGKQQKSRIQDEAKKDFPEICYLRLNMIGD